MEPKYKSDKIEIYELPLPCCEIKDAWTQKNIVISNIHDAKAIVNFLNTFIDLFGIGKGGE